MKFLTPIKDTTVSDFPPTVNQTHLTSFDQGRGCNNGRNNRGRGQNGGRYTSRCQLFGQFEHRVLERRERFNKSFYGYQNVVINPTTRMFPLTYNTNLQPPTTPQDHSAWYLDRGATHHVTNDVQNRIDPTLSRSRSTSSWEQNRFDYSFNWLTSLISRSHPLKLVNILHVLEIWKKLLSTYRLTNDNAV